MLSAFVMTWILVLEANCNQTKPPHADNNMKPVFQRNLPVLYQHRQRVASTLRLVGMSDRSTIYKYDDLFTYTVVRV